ncbi:hypothetical protein BJ508DRAFT_323729 [Ascobolus immersus RN42]|uniref:Uncharacterized protein n=1 Tax=Ascobolus immersus RN42 TaxID=1160509 RepID=A0A3N4IFS6_ASCIM|nr:hypothetical protein BJ508DRAFT_323729 [Ascobolus immersus RN42]
MHLPTHSIAQYLAAAASAVVTSVAEVYHRSRKRKRNIIEEPEVDLAEEPLLPIVSPSEPGSKLGKPKLRKLQRDAKKRRKRKVRKSEQIPQIVVPVSILCTSCGWHFAEDGTVFGISPCCKAPNSCPTIAFRHRILRSLGYEPKVPVDSKAHLMLLLNISGAQEAYFVESELVLNELRVFRSDQVKTANYRCQGAIFSVIAIENPPTGLTSSMFKAIIEMIHQDKQSQLHDLENGFLDALQSNTQINAQSTSTTSGLRAEKTLASLDACYQLMKVAVALQADFVTDMAIEAFGQILVQSATQPYSMWEETKSSVEQFQLLYEGIHEEHMLDYYAMEDDETGVIRMKRKMTEFLAYQVDKKAPLFQKMVRELAVKDEGFAQEFILAFGRCPAYPWKQEDK